jgi:TorA maturation chaperone TorD
MTLTNAQHEDANAEHSVAIPIINETALQAPEQKYRAGTYALLGALLRNVPTAELLAHTATLKDAATKSDDLGIAMSMLGLAAEHTDLDAVDDEYHDLFIGLGRGEVVPYGSWYLTGFLMEKPLGELREHLSALGYQRDPSVKEPEDHVAALFEVMGMLIQEGRSTDVQQQFFSQHMLKWLGRFFDDLSAADSASFYQAVARFGAAFFNFEQQYFGLDIQE